MASVVVDIACYICNAGNMENKLTAVVSIHSKVDFQRYTVTEFIRSQYCTNQSNLVSVKCCHVTDFASSLIPKINNTAVQVRASGGKNLVNVQCSYTGRSVCIGVINESSAGDDSCCIAVKDISVVNASSRGISRLKAL